jgi:hypothetical protein
MAWKRIAIGLYKQPQRIKKVSLKILCCVISLPVRRNGAHATMSERPSE